MGERARDQDQDAGKAGGQVVDHCLDVDEEEGTFSSASFAGCRPVSSWRRGEGVKNPSKSLNPRMAWELRRLLAKVSLFLWDCYEEEFLIFVEEESAARRRRSLE